jgi:hypothetical protein
MTAEQIAWIRADLTLHQDAALRVMMFHTPVASSAFFGRNENLRVALGEILYEYRVDLIVHGHEHHYERGTLDRDTILAGADPSLGTDHAVRYMILGGGGSLNDPAVQPIPEAEVVSGGPCYTLAAFSGNALTLTTLTLDGAQVDQVVLEAAP